ncbi:hypothetical protein YPPY13_0671, partial [Yersinia pestis PY-13]
MGACQLWLNP